MGKCFQVQSGCEFEVHLRVMASGDSVLRVMESNDFVFCVFAVENGQAEGERHQVEQEDAHVQLPCKELEREQRQRDMEAEWELMQQQQRREDDVLDLPEFSI